MSRSRFVFLGLALMLTLTLTLTGWGLVFAADTFSNQVVYVIPVRGTIGAGLTRYVERGLQEAAARNATQVIIPVDTLGGTISAALEIRDAIIRSPIPTTSLVENRAWSAGALIAISTNQFYMTPGSTIGAAEPRPAEEKIISAWRTELEETADYTGRDPQVAAAMVDSDIEIPNLIARGKILTLGASRAQELGFSDGTVASLEELYSQRGWQNPTVVQVSENQGEVLARFVTHPNVAPLLLTLGFLGLVVELFVPGFGVPGIIGIASLSLYFGGHMIAGLAGWQAIAAFLVGVVLLAIEVFIPGFGVFGLVGVAVIVGSIFLAAQSPQQALRSLSISLITTIVAVFVLVRYVGPRGLWQRLLLFDRLDTDRGFVSQVEPVELVGMKGTAMTPLRPAGTVKINGEPHNVVTEGGFIPRGTEVVVVKIEGARIVVRANV